MKIYCEICGKEFIKKYYYDRHKNRKNPCKPKNNNTQPVENNYHKSFLGNENISSIPLQNSSIPPKITPNIFKIPPITSIHPPIFTIIKFHNIKKNMKM